MHCSDTYKTAYSDTFASTYMYVSLCIWGRGRVSPCELCHLSTHAYMFFVLFSFLLHYDIYLWPFSLPLAFCGPEGVHVQAKSEDTIRGIVKFVGVNGLQMPYLICCTHTYVHMYMWISLSFHQRPYHTFFAHFVCFVFRAVHFRFPFPRIFPAQTTELSGQMSRLFACHRERVMCSIICDSIVIEVYHGVAFRKKNYPKWSFEMYFWELLFTIVKKVNGDVKFKCQAKSNNKCHKYKFF